MNKVCVRGQRIYFYRPPEPIPKLQVNFSRIEFDMDETWSSFLSVVAQFIQNGEPKNVKVEDGIYKTGLYVKDSLVGLGTLSYIDPVSKIYGALGHEVTMNETGSRIDVRNGNILYSKVIGIDKSRNGRVGSKDAKIVFNKVLGSITKNTNKGIYGIYSDSLPNKETIEVSSFSDIEKGSAYILTVTKDNKIEKYNINIIDKYYNKKDTQKAFSFEIIDKNLISKTGGIVQGMSGSPIIQNNKIIGAVTNVLVENVTLGYGISIITMLEEGES